MIGVSDTIYIFRPRHQCPFKARLSPGGLTLNEDVANTKELLIQQRKERRTKQGQTSLKQKRTHIWQEH